MPCNLPGDPQHRWSLRDDRETERDMDEINPAPTADEVTQETADDFEDLLAFAERHRENPAFSTAAENARVPELLARVAESISTSAGSG